MASTIIFYLVFAANLLLAGFLGWSLYDTHLIPSQYVYLAAGLLILIPLLLFLLQKEKKGQKKKTGARVAAIVLLLFLSILEGAGAYFVHQYNSKMRNVTEVHSQYTEVGLYVKNEDKAQTIEYAVERQYRVGILEGVDTEAVDHVRGNVEKQYGRTMKTVSYSSLADLAKAMREGEIDAMLLSSAYLDLIDSLEGFEEFSQGLRSLYAGSFKTEILVPPVLEHTEKNKPEDLGLRDPALWKDSFCAYVSGIDTYGPVTTRSRSDVNILAVVNTKTKTVLLISTPRDYYVPFQFSPVNGAMDKLTHAGIYGIEGSMRALGDYYELPIHYYLRVNFSGFIDIIDTLGGVDVESDADFGFDGHQYYKGMNHLNGRAALGFVRNRYSFGEGDRARGRHQMAVIKGIINGLMSSKIITNYSELLDEMAGCLQTNASRSMIGDLVQLTLDRKKGDWKVLTYSVDGYGATEYAWSLGAYAYVMVPYANNRDYARELVTQVLANEVLTQDDLQAKAPKN